MVIRRRGTARPVCSVWKFSEICDRVKHRSAGAQKAVILEDACRSIDIEGSAAARSRLQAIGALCVASGALG
jgi:hypothetical protein